MKILLKKYRDSYNSCTFKNSSVAKKNVVKKTDVIFKHLHPFTLLIQTVYL
jgi:hypothetical protein